MLISLTISVNGYQNVVENTQETHLSLHAEPTIIKTFVNPQKARCGETITVYALIHDATGIERVNATFFHEAGADTVEMNLLAGTERFGLWSGRWKVHDTLEKEYTVRVNAFSSSGLSSSSEAIWRDPSHHWWNINWRYRKPITVDNPSSQDLYEYQILINLSYSSNMKSDFSDLRFTWYNVTANREEEIPYYIEKKVDGKWALIWVKVTEIKSSSSSTVYVYYGNPAADSASNISATFSYSEPRTIGYIVSDKIVSNGIKIMSLCDNNTIIIGNHTLKNLNEQETVSIPSNSVQIGDAVKVKGLAQIEGAGNVDDMIVPISWAGKLFIYGGMRDSQDTFCMLCPWGTANVTIYDGGTQVWSGTVDSSGVCITKDITSGKAVRIESDIPILVSRYGKGGEDAWVFYPATTDYLYGPSVSNDAFVAAGSEGATISYVASNGNSDTTDVGKDSQIDLGSYVGSGNSGSGPAIRIKGSEPIGAIQQADHDGTESTVFVPLKEMGTKFGSAIAAEYIVVAAPYPNTVCKVYNSAGNLIETKTGGSRNDINRIGFGTGSDDVYVEGGWKLESDKPVWVYYEAHDNGDETNLLGYKQMRQYVWPEPEYTVGAEEVAIPTKPILEEPEDNACISNGTPTFRWIPGKDADNHTLLVDDQNDFLSPEINVTLGPDATSYNESVLSEGRWYWKVIANNTNGKNESDVRSFIVDKTPPLPPELNSPSDGYVTDDREVTFIWNSTQDNRTNSGYVSGIDHYEIQIDDDPNFTSPLVDTSTSTSITERVEGRLYWRVRAWDRAGNPSKFSEVRNITVFSFTLSTSSSNLQMMKGSSLSINISTSVEFGEPEDISFNYLWIGGIKPSRIDLTFSPSTVYGTNSSVLTITSENTASTGTFTCRIFATSEINDYRIERYIDIKITIYGMLFSILCFPQDVTLTRSDEKSISVSVEFDQGALDIVSFSGKWIGDSPEGISISINPSSGVPPFEATITVSTSRNAQQGDYIYQLIATGSGLTRTINIYLHVRTDLSLEINTDRETYERGDVIKFYGTVKDPFGEEVDDGTVKIQITAENRSLCCIETKVTSGKFSASYCITFDKPLGKWLISATAADNKGDTTRNVTRLNIFVEASEGYRHYSINVLSPPYGQIFRRGETVTFTAIVTDDGRKVSGAAVRGYLPDGDIIVFSEGEPGFYTSSYKLRYDCEIENWTVYIEAVKDTDGVLKSGFAWATFRVLPAKPIYQIINQLPRKVEAGEEVEIEIKALYPDGTPVEDGVIKATARDGEEIVFNPIGSGIYVASFKPEESGTDYIINVTISDSYGNVATLDIGRINVTSPSISTYAIRYWWATLALSSLTAVAVGTFTHRRLLFIRLRKYRKEIQNLERQKRTAAERYFLKGEITREAYDKIIQECENRIAELSKKCGILEKEIRKLRRVKS